MPMSPGVKTYHTNCTRGGGQYPHSEILLHPPRVGAENSSVGWGDWYPSHGTPKLGSRFTWQSAGSTPIINFAW